MAEFDADPQYDLKTKPPVQAGDNGLIEGLFDGIFYNYVSEDWKLRQLVFLGPLDASRFGHDGQGECWYKSTCFTGTEVQILTQRRCRVIRPRIQWWQDSGFASANCENRLQ